MARQRRIEYEGAFYHVLARGNRRERMIHGPGDADLFCKTLAEVCMKTGWRVHARVLMTNHYHCNHYHWVLETPAPDLMAGMKWFQNAFTRRMNCRHRLRGHLFGGRYKAIPVEPGNDDNYPGTLIDYVHLNPDNPTLRRTNGSYRPKVMLAKLLHQRTTVSQTWITQKLFTGSAANVCQQLRRFNQCFFTRAERRQWRLLSTIDDCPREARRGSFNRPLFPNQPVTPAGATSDFAPRAKTAAHGRQTPRHLRGRR